MLLILGAIAVGVALLSRAADAFVTGAARLAVMLRISPIVVGAVIVGFGTSAPEMVVSGIAATQGDGDLGIGNIIGSNLANLSLILGTAALIVPLTIDARVLRREGPIATVAAVTFAVLVQDGISRAEGVLMLVLMAVGLTLLFVGGGDDPSLVGEVEELASDEDATVLGEALRTVVGLTGTVAGAWLLVWGATELAERYGVNDGFVGVTLVALGTSLPELVTAIVAARQGQTGLIVGNLLGSNLFNSFAVGAVVGLLGDGGLVDPSLTGLDLWFMLAICLIAAAFMYTRRAIERYEGGAMLGLFGGFLIATWWDEARESAAAVIEFAAGQLG